MNETSTRAPRFLKYILAAVTVLAGLLLLFVNGNLAALAEFLWPGSAPFAHAVLLSLEALAVFWFWRGLFRGPRHLLLMDRENPEARQAFVKELARRMRSNPLIREAGITPADSGKDTGQEYLDRCLAHLKNKADEEIRQNSKRIFLATALSQNGRLDALIVFFSLCRLVWRVSAIYNQRPHPSEVVSLYWAVASSTFLAFSMEELDIATEITVGFGEAFHAMAPASMTASIPFVGSALKTFTASTIDGAANCYLALRAGIITRNAYAYAPHREQAPSRAAVFREAGAMLLDMSQELAGKVAGAVGSGISGAARSAAHSAGEKTVRTGKDIVEGISRVGQGIGTGAGRLAGGTVSGATKIASGTVDTVDKLAGGVADTAVKLASGTLGTAGKVASGAVQAVQATGSGIAKAGSYTADKVGRLADKAASETRALIRLPGNILQTKPRKEPPPAPEPALPESAGPEASADTPKRKPGGKRKPS